MNRIKLSSLRTGQILDKPLYDSDKTLLLSPGNALTSDTLSALRRRGREYVLIGEWDDEDARLSLASYTDEAKHFALALEARLREQISPKELDFLPSGEALDSAIERMLAPQRSVEQIQNLTKMREGGIELIGKLIDGGVPAGKMSQLTDELMQGTLEALTKDPSLMATLLTLKGSDDYLYQHSMNTVILAMAIAGELGYNKQQAGVVGVCALYHDVGMADVNPELLNERRRLSPTEMVDVQKHVGYSLDRLSNVMGVTRVAHLVAHQHHERIDGSGYPHRRVGNLVHRATRIVSLADVYDALASTRPWRGPYSPPRVMRYVVEEGHAGRLDNECVKGLLRYLSYYPIGSYVLLSDGATARVVHANREAYSRPVVRVVKDVSGNVIPEPYAVDLTRNQELKIVLALEKKPNLPEFAGF